MKLSEIATGTTSVSFQGLGTDVPLARQVQRRLIAVGCLDPRADGQFGAVSRLAVARFARHLKLPFDDAVTPAIAAALRKHTADTFIPLKPGNDFAGRIVKYMLRKEYFVARLPHFLTIVYVEGADARGKPNRNLLDKWNDRRIVLRIDPTGKPVIDCNTVSTTEPGRHFTEQPLNPGGAARIALGQFKAWRIGTHKAGTPTEHRALVQVDNIRIFRDKNQDGSRKGDTEDVGSGFGINQHSGHNASTTSIGLNSAGCLVARLDADHQDFMRRIARDPRRAKASSGYTYMTAVISGRDLAREFPLGR